MSPLPWLAGFALSALLFASPVAAFEPKCPVEDGRCWIELADKPGCHAWVWREDPSEWSGACTAGLASGEGRLSWADGAVHEGTFVNGIRHGRWTERYDDGAVHEGVYVAGKRQGRWTEREPDGNVAEGPYVDDESHGRWALRFADGRAVEGTYVGDNPHGRWTLRHADGRCEGMEYRRGKIVDFFPC